MTRLAFLLFSLSLPLLVAGDELSELKVKLRDKDKWARKSAVEKLADVGSTEAWSEVIGVLDDPAGEVADTAQWELGRVADEDSLELLFGKEALGAKDEWVRLRAAEALGRLTVPVDAGELRRAAGDKDPAVRRAWAASIARLGASQIEGDPAKLVDAVAKQATKDRDERAAGEAWMALAALDAERAREEWADVKLDRAPAAVLCAAARSADALALSNEALLSLGAPSASGSSGRGGGEAGGRAVRIDAARALARRGTAASARALVELLAAEPEPRLARGFADLLRGMSGLKHGRDPRPWRDWAAGLADDWRAAPADPDEDERWSDADDDERSVALAGLPIRSGRIAFLIDLSGSMWTERADGKTRKQAVDVELEKCLAGLPETTRFNVIPYTRDPIPWKDELVDATPRNTTAAAKWFEERRDSGTGNFWGAFELALADPEVDTIIMLGDGEPTGGPRYKLELLPEVIADENLGRAVTIDSILVGNKVARRTQTAWRRIARESGGTSIVVEL